MSSVPQFPPAHLIPEETSDQKQDDSTIKETKQTNEPLALPAPNTEVERVNKLEVGSEPLKLDHLGPMVVNSDGTLSRIHNWGDMTEMEREKTVRILAKRNKIRMDQLQASGVTPQ